MIFVSFHPQLNISWENVQKTVKLAWNSCPTPNNRRRSTAVGQPKRYLQNNQLLSSNITDEPIVVYHIICIYVRPWTNNFFLDGLYLAKNKKLCKNEKSGTPESFVQPETRVVIAIVHDSSRDTCGPRCTRIARYDTRAVVGEDFPWGRLMIRRNLDDYTYTSLGELRRNATDPLALPTALVRYSGGERRGGRILCRRHDYPFVDYGRFAPRVERTKMGDVLVMVYICIYRQITVSRIQSCGWS